MFIEKMRCPLRDQGVIVQDGAEFKINKDAKSPKKMESRWEIKSNRTSYTVASKWVRAILGLQFDGPTVHIKCAPCEWDKNVWEGGQKCNALHVCLRPTSVEVRNERTKSWCPCCLHWWITNQFANCYYHNREAWDGRAM